MPGLRAVIPLVGMLLNHSLPLFAHLCFLYYSDKPMPGLRAVIPLVGMLLNHSLPLFAPAVLFPQRTSERAQVLRK
jgi:hypothetical protein